jgi:hypothetical protein
MAATIAARRRIQMILRCNTLFCDYNRPTEYRDV